MYYMATVVETTKVSDFFYYHVLPGDVQLHNPKTIYIWTTYFRDYQHWKWGIGPTPVISDCNDAEIDKKCVITTHEKMLEKCSQGFGECEKIESFTNSIKKKYYLPTSLQSVELKNEKCLGDTTNLCIKGIIPQTQGICHGDSGGPIMSLDMSNGQYEIIGINSLGSSLFVFF